MQSELTNEFVLRLNRAFSREDKSLILDALDFSSRILESSVEESIHIAELVMDQHADRIVIAALFLIPLRKMEVLTHRAISERFGEVTADLVESVHRQELIRNDNEHNRRNDLKALLQSFTGDIRSAVLQVGTRLSTLERARNGERDLRALARETLDLYVPLAGRLGMGAMRSRLEDVCFCILEPDVHENLKRTYEPIRKEDHACLELLIDGMQKLLKRNQISALVKGRTKGLYSLVRKMRRDDLSLEAITDKIGVRIIVSRVPDCYSVLGLLHTHFQPIPGKFKDYIGLPKDNGYQSLHTCVYPVRKISHKPVEIQIRTESMDVEAEFGVAAHWYYKTQSDSHAENLRQLAWLRSLQGEHDTSAGHEAFIERLRTLVYSNEIVVFGDRGEQIRLPAGSTVSVFASGLGLAVSSGTLVYVNGKESSLEQVLKDGDTVLLNLDS